MAAFGAKTFSRARYAARRPDYPQHIYDTILNQYTPLPHHILDAQSAQPQTNRPPSTHPPQTLLVDLGCGHAPATASMSPHFAHSIATDISPAMLTAARSHSDPSRSIDFHAAPADSLPFLAPSTVSLVVSTQAAHWFPYPSTWREISRVLRPGGTVAFVCSADPVFPGLPNASRLLHELCYATPSSSSGDAASGSRAERGEYPLGHLGEHYAEPGRSIVENLQRELVPPGEFFEDVRRIEYFPEGPGTAGLAFRNRGAVGVEEGEGPLERTMRVGEFKEYMRTWSAFHNWAEGRGGEEGGRDVVDWIVEEMKGVEAAWGDEEFIKVQWPVGLMMARRKGVE